MRHSSGIRPDRTVQFEYGNNAGMKESDTMRNFAVILDDGSTFSGLAGCSIMEVPDDVDTEEFIKEQAHLPASDRANTWDIGRLFHARGKH